MTRSTAAAAALAFLAYSADASAKCSTDRYRFAVEKNDIAGVTMKGSPGDHCNTSFRSSPESTLKLTSATVTSPAKNGEASASTSGMTYVPKTGFSGTDAFTVKVCGENKAGKGCSTLNVSVTLR
jgi:hypothetical protein